MVTVDFTFGVEKRNSEGRFFERVVLVGIVGFGCVSVSGLVVHGVVSFGR